MNFGTVKKMFNLNLTPKLKFDPSSKCEVCVQVKHVRKPFPLIDRTFVPLELIHSDLCDSNKVLSRGENGTL